MNITIKSDFEFNELVYDKAFGLAKRMILKKCSTKTKKYYGFVITANLELDSVMVKIHKC